MATTQLAQSSGTTKPLIQGKRLDYLFIIPCLWFVAGTFLDAWAHSNIPQLESFFTPWHGILYTGVLANVVFLLAVALINRRRGATWQEALPAGHDITLFAVVAMLFVGVADGFWHTFFGVEQNIDAIFSPTHLAGMICSVLISLGIFRALCHRQQELKNWSDKFLLAIAFTLPLAMITNNTQPTHPFIAYWPTFSSIARDPNDQMMAILGYILQAVILCSLTLYTMRRWTKLPFGLFTFALTIDAAALSLMQYHFIMIAVGLIAGLIIDVAYLLLKPSETRPTQFRLFAAIPGTALLTVYFLTLTIMFGMTWTIHMTWGTVFIMAIIGWSLSYLALPGTSNAQPLPH